MSPNGFPFPVRYFLGLGDPTLTSTSPQTITNYIEVTDIFMDNHPDLLADQQARFQTPFFTPVVGGGLLDVAGSEPSQWFTDRVISREYHPGLLETTGHVCLNHLPI